MTKKETLEKLPEEDAKVLREYACWYPEADPKETFQFCSCPNSCNCTGQDACCATPCEATGGSPG